LKLSCKSRGAATYWIVNTRTRKYCAIEDCGFNGDWKEDFEHTKGADWYDVTAFRICEPDKVNGIYYVYDLCPDGGLFTFLVDTELHDAEAVEDAKEELRRRHDVVRLQVLRLKKAG